jgi:GTP-binding protein HflX
VSSLGELVAQKNAELVIVNAQLSPVQQRNLEKAWSAKVLDRTGLILEIFGERAHTREGSLQVELAHLQYQKSRLVRSWTHLERQRGGFGFLGGPGESQLEIDRRLIQQRITRIETELESVKRTRSLHRQSRARVPYPVAALVGYTNAGKSTLFNKLTNSGVMAENLLFATLDPTMREVELPHGRKIILSDTVGFISDLPTMLVAAFRATLEEVLSADLILHVRDISHEDSEAQSEDVESVLNDLGIDEVRRREMIEVWNKSDLVADPEARRALVSLSKRREGTALVSALTGQGIDSLLTLIEQRLAVASLTFEIELGPGEGQDLSWLYSRGEVLSRTDDEQGLVRLAVRFDPAVAPLAQSRFGVRLKSLHDGLQAAAE